MTKTAVSRADSSNPDAAEAIAEIDAALKFSESALTVLFCAPSYDLPALESAIAQLGPGGCVIGCTSAGEIGSKGYQNQSISGFSLGTEDFTVAHTTISNLKEFSMDGAHAAVATLKESLLAQSIDTDQRKCFALLLVDGLSIAEEPLTYKLQEALRDIPLIGGSAGDGMDFGKTHVLADGTFKSDTAVLAMIYSARPWEVLKEQHINPTDTKLVVTESDPENRIVVELNGEPAAEELARCIGLSGPEALTSAVLAKNPFMLKLGGNWFIRSAHTVRADNALALFCGIEEGLVLSVGKADDLIGSLNTALEGINQRLGGIQLLIACDCILRRLELDGTQRTQAGSEVLTKYNAVGFSTYGEQFGTVHVNQTLTAIAIG